MPNSLPFLQDPELFLQSYFWGCNQGHQLSLKCRQQLAQMPSTPEQPRSAKPDAQGSERMMESLLDCYVHTKVCVRCGPMEAVACQKGYELAKERDSAFDEVFRLGVTGGHLDDRDDSLGERELHAVFNKEFAQREFVLHMSNCQECSVKPPRGRYSLAAWNIEAARSQRL
jgi:hypothetical protein